MVSEIFKSEVGASGRKETGRLEALSDGIFAIAMTLLVLEIHVPVVAADESFAQAILEKWPELLAFAIGFFTLLVCWINHHYMFEAIHKTDGILLLLNGFRLLVVSFTPFATALLSNYITTSNEQDAATVHSAQLLRYGIGYDLPLVLCMPTRLCTVEIAATPIKQV